MELFARFCNSKLTDVLSLTRTIRARGPLGGIPILSVNRINCRPVSGYAINLNKHCIAADVHAARCFTYTVGLTRIG